MRLHPHEIAIGFIAGNFDDGCDYPDPRSAFDHNKANAHEFLVELTGENFGLNAAGWRAWFADCDKELVDFLYDEYFKEVSAVLKSRKDRELSWAEFLRRLKERGEEL